MLLYITKITVSYLQQKKKEMGLPDDQVMIFDEFKGQTTEKVLSCLDENNTICNGTLKLHRVVAAT